MPNDTKILDTLKLPPKECEKILASLAQKAGEGKGDNQRKESRIPMTDVVVICKLQAVGGPTQFAVKCRNVSRRGVGFLHGAYVHAGTRCEVTIITRRRVGFRATGKVVRCRHVGDKVHEVGVRLDSDLDLVELVQ
jgi:hypothetical protein